MSYTTCERMNDLVTAEVFTHEVFEELVAEVSRLRYPGIHMLFMASNISSSAMEYMIENNIVTDGFSLVIIATKNRIHIDERLRLMSRFLEKGADVNDQCFRSGESVLSDFIEWVDEGNWEDLMPDDVEGRRSMIEDNKRLLTFLLENGADPLLENKEGVSPISRHAEPYRYMTTDLILFFGDEMRKYA
jgi:hypothetical protein